MFFGSFLSSFCSDAAVLSCWVASAIEECPCHERLHLVCSGVWGSGVSQRGVLVNAGLKVSQQNVTLSQDDLCCYFICHWFQSCGGSLYIHVTNKQT